MRLKKSGILLFCKNYEKCVKFYHDNLGLDIIFSETGFLTNFVFGDSYLMVENANVIFPKQSQNLTAKTARDISNNPSVIRFDVATEEFETTANELRSQHIEVETNNFEWGMVASFYDPDGNRCEIYAPQLNMPDNYTKR